MDLIGLKDTAHILGVSRQRAHVLYQMGRITPRAVVGTAKRPVPLFDREYILWLAEQRGKQQTAA
jgi:hypothetical protein